MRLSLCFLVSVVSGAALVLAQNQEEKPVQPLKPLTWTPENIKCRTSRSRGISPTGPAPELKLCCEGADYKNCIHCTFSTYCLPFHSCTHPVVISYEPSPIDCIVMRSLTRIDDRFRNGDNLQNSRQHRLLRQCQGTFD